MHSVVQQEVDSIGDNNNNCFKSLLFDLFPNVKEIIIYTRSYYTLNISILLSIIDSSFLPKSFERILVKEYKESKWISKVYGASFCSKYIDSNLSIDFKSQKDKGDELVISIVE